MAELIAVGFKGIHRASEVLDEVQQLNAEWRIDLHDAVAVYRSGDGRLRIEQSVQATSKDGAVGGGIVGGMLGGLLGGLLAAPFTGGATLPVATAAAISLSSVALGATTGALIGEDDAATWKQDYGISEDFVKQVGGMVKPGDSALFVLARTSDPISIAERFRGYGGTVLRTTLAPEKARKLQELLAAQNEPAMT